MHDTDFILWARNIVLRLGADTRNAGNVAEAIKSYVGSAIQYAPDPAGFEHIMPPTEHMKCLKQQPRILGDCDDAASLAAGLAGALGIPGVIEARAFWQPNAPFQHVVTVLKPRDSQPVECDTTHNAQKLPMQVFRRLAVRYP